MAEKKSEEAKSEIVQVVAQLPVEAYNAYTTPEGDSYKLLTIEQALSELIVSVRELKKGLL
jgi:hypothetical protein